MYSKKNIKFLIGLIMAITIIISIIVKAPKINSENYIASDATYHTLLTIEAYDKTPVSIHKFLPIVTLGDEQDKFISWGATVPDELGNFYYTSFSPAGFVVPYIFIKLFNLEINEMNLYFFNSFLYILSALFLTVIFKKIYKDRISNFNIYIFTFIIYLFQTETLHSQGLVYWHQSLFQVLFLLQVIMFLNRENKRIYRFIFFALCIINPYVEWSGYIANIGFAITLFLNKTIKFTKQKIEISTKMFFEFIGIIITTIVAFIIFSIHYISVIPINQYIVALIKRFSSRSFEKVTIDLLLNGYMKSYFYLVIIIGLLLLIVLLTKESRKKFIYNLKNDRIIWFIFCFPLLENIIMMQHACQYTFDRLKMIFILILLFFNIFISLQIKFENCIKFKLSMLIIVLGISVLNFWNYINYNTSYRWKVDYLENNQNFSYYLNDKFNEYNSVLGQAIPVRGYDNLLFNRGIYEKVDDERVVDIANKKNKQFAISLLVEKKTWNMDKYLGCNIYDLERNTIEIIRIDDGEIKKIKTDD